MKISGEVVFFLCINHDRKVEELEEIFKVKAKKQELYGLKRYIAARRRAPYVFTLNPVTVEYHGEKIDIKPER